MQNTKLKYIYLQTIHKGAPCSFGKQIQTQNPNIYNDSEVIIQTQKYLFLFTTE